MNAAEPGVSTRTPCRFTPWLGWDDSGMDWMRAQADLLAGVSLCNAHPPPELFDFCRERRIGTLRLAGGKPVAFDTPGHARATIAEYLRLCGEIGYGGIDLDFEHMPQELAETYNRFIRDLGTALHGEGKRLSICVFGVTEMEVGKPKQVFFWEPAVLAECCDEVRVMCYDYTMAGYGMIGPTTHWYWAYDAMRYWLQYIPRAKLVMGMPAYGNDFPAEPGSGNGRQVIVDHPSQFPGATAIEETWLHHERVNFYRYRDADKRPRLMYATDARSTRNLLTIVERLKLEAISVWHATAMTPGIRQTLAEWLGADSRTASKSSLSNRIKS